MASGHHPRLTAFLLTVLLAATALAGCADNSGGGTTTPTGATTTTPGGAATGPDFGDAPDGAATGYPAPYAQTGDFPTKLASGGARVADLGQARLGEGATGEADALASDADDGPVDMVLVLTQLPPPAALTVRVVGPAGSAGGTYHVNVLFDQNLDGAWTEDEWVVKNHPVDVVAGESQNVALPPFAMTQSLTLPDGAWMRVALTKEQAPAGWTGEGLFTAGEIEDFNVEFPRIDGKPPAIAVMTCPATVDFGGQATALVTCTINNVAPVGHGDQIRWTLTRLTGAVTIDTTTNVETIAPGAAKAITFTATKEQPLPSKWRYNAVGIDPPAEVKDDTIVIGHGESEGETEFRETAKACAFLVAQIETSREHRAGESDAIFWVFLKKYFDNQIADAETQAFADAVVQASASSGQPLRQTGHNEQGAIELRQTVFSYGEYPMTIQDIEMDGCEFDAENSELTATASVQPG